MQPISAAIRATAKMNFIRTVSVVAVIGVLTVIAALIYLSLTNSLRTPMVVAVIGGVFFSVVLGAGLMAVGFYSERSGIDDDATGPPGPIDEV